MWQPPRYLELAPNLKHVVHTRRQENRAEGAGGGRAEGAVKKNCTNSNKKRFFLAVGAIFFTAPFHTASFAYDNVSINRKKIQKRSICC